MRFRFLSELVVWTVVVTFSFSGVTPAFSGSRIIPSKVVKVYEGEKLVQVLKQESPFPNGALLTTEGKCGVRFEDFYIVAEDKTTFGVVDGRDRKDLRVDSGVVYFAANEKTGQLNFITPAGDITTEQIRLSASASGGMLKGYLDVNGSQVQLGVLDGGTMVVATDTMKKEITNGQQLTLALADPVKEQDKPAVAKKEEDPATEEEEDDDEIPAAYFVGGAAALGAALFGIANATGGGGGGQPLPASPVAP